MVGINDNIESEFIIYPNPANNLIWIKSSRHIDQIFIFNISGVKEGQINKPEFPLAIEKFKSGIYFLEIIENQHKHYQKLIVR